MQYILSVVVNQEKEASANAQFLLYSVVALPQSRAVLRQSCAEAESRASAEMLLRLSSDDDDGDKGQLVATRVMPPQVKHNSV